MSGVKIGGKHTQNDWGLIMTDFMISPAEPKTYIIPVPFASKTIDLTEMYGQVTYDRRTISLVFISLDESPESWHSVYSSIQNYCHGKEMELIFDADAGHYWKGRVFVEEAAKIDQIHGSIKINMDAEPYKYDVSSTVEDWLWDPFDFEEGVIREYSQINITGSLNMVVIGSPMPVIPSIKSSAAMTLKVSGQTFSLKAGTQKLYDLTLVDKEYTFQFTGTGTVSIDFRGGSL